MVGNVARFIMEQEDRPAYAFLELSFAEIYNDSRRFPSEFEGAIPDEKKYTNRVDLAFYSNASKVQYALEFKKYGPQRGSSMMPPDLRDCSVFWEQSRAGR